MPRSALILGAVINFLLDHHPNLLETMVPGLLDLNTHQFHALETRPHLGWSSVEIKRHMARTACMVCQGPMDTILKCSACNAVWYCSPRCQKLDWHSHKDTCAQVKNHSLVPQHYTHLLEDI